MNALWEQALALLWRRSRFTSYFYQSVSFMENHDIPTLALTVRADGFCLYYHPGFIGSLGVEERIGLLVHEMLHVVFSHRHRAKPGADPYLQNLAQDMVVNSYMDRRGDIFFSRKDLPAREVPPLTLPAGLPRIPEAFFEETGIPDPPWEEVYRWLKNQPPAAVSEMTAAGQTAPGNAPALEAGEWNRLREAFMPGGPERFEEAMSRLRLEGTDGLVFENNRGQSLPTGMHLMRAEQAQRRMEARRLGILELTRKDPSSAEERMFGEISGIISGARQADTSPWKAMMHSIVDYSSRSGEWDYTYGRFNRRYGAEGIYAPGRVYKHRRLVTVAVDVSGSMVMRPAEIEAAFGVVEDLLGRFVVHLLCVDEDLFVPRRGEGSFGPDRDTAKPFVYRKGDWRHIRTGSGGTTFFAPLFNGYMPGHRELLMVITDGDIYDLEKLRKYSPTLWVVSGHRSEPFIPPFGKKVEIGRL